MRKVGCSTLYPLGWIGALCGLVLITKRIENCESELAGHVVAMHKLLSTTPNPRTGESLTYSIPPVPIISQITG